MKLPKLVPIYLMAHSRPGVALCCSISAGVDNKVPDFDNENVTTRVVFRTALHIAGIHSYLCT